MEKDVEDEREIENQGEKIIEKIRIWVVGYCLEYDERGIRLERREKKQLERWMSDLKVYQILIGVVRR